jgi:hypothetical protein
VGVATSVHGAGDVDVGSRSIAAWSVGFACEDIEALSICSIVRACREQDVSIGKVICSG